MKLLTEFEGAILMEIGRQPRVTAFQVRRAFQSSPSSAWSSSAGAVYTAVERLIDAGLITTSAPLDGRGTRHLHLTHAGRNAHRSWLLDASAACALGSDPFRLRAPGWLDLPARDYRAVLTGLETELSHQLSRLNDFKRYDADPHDKVRVAFAIDMIRSRLRWVQDQRRRQDAV